MHGPSSSCSSTLFACGHVGTRCLFFFFLQTWDQWGGWCCCHVPCSVALNSHHFEISTAVTEMAEINIYFFISVIRGSVQRSFSLLSQPPPPQLLACSRRSPIFPLHVLQWWHPPQRRDTGGHECVWSWLKGGAEGVCMRVWSCVCVSLCVNVSNSA